MPRKRKQPEQVVEERSVDTGSDTDSHSDADSEASDVVAAPKKAKTEEGERAADAAPEGMLAQAKSALLWLCSTAPDSTPDPRALFSGAKKDSDAAAESSSNTKPTCCKK